MELDIRSKVSLTRDDNVLEDIVEVRKELYNQIVSFIRNSIGSGQGLGDDQIYVKFKSSLMELYFDLRPKETSWPIVLLDTFMPDLVNWQAHLRVQNIFHVESLFKKFDSDLSINE